MDQKKKKTGSRDSVTREKKTKQNKERLIEAMRSSLGVVSAACEEAELDRGTFYRYMKNDPDFKETINDIENIAIDFVETALFKKIKGGDTTSIIFFLKTKAKHRGYIEKVEVDVNDRTVSETTQFNLHKVG